MPWNINFIAPSVKYIFYNTNIPDKIKLILKQSINKFPVRHDFNNLRVNTLRSSRISAEIGGVGIDLSGFKKAPIYSSGRIVNTVP